MMLTSDVRVYAGVDTHADTHTVAVLDDRGAFLGQATFPTTAAGHRALWVWLAGHGAVVGIGIEGTGSYGKSLTRHVSELGVLVREVNRPDRAHRRQYGKSDPADAVAAARAVLAGTATAIPKAGTGAVESLRVLHATRRSALKARTAAWNSLRQLLITAPQDLRAHLDGLAPAALLRTCAGMRPDPGELTNPTHAVKTSLRRLARRIQALEVEIRDAEHDLDTLTATLAPQLRAARGVGPAVAAQLLITAGDNPDRIHSDAAFAALCGVSPVQASSGRTHRHRLNRGGDRHANSALWWVAIGRMGHDPRTRAYVERALAKNKTKPEIIRTLKRYIARELLPLIQASLTQPPALEQAA